MSTPINQDVINRLGLSAEARSRQTKEGSGQDDFLALMVAQMKNQDPFKPMESGQYLSQLAEFGTVSGIKDLQGTFKDLASSLQANQAMMASSLVGKDVLIETDQAMLRGEEGVDGIVDLPFSADSLTVSIYDANGQYVSRVDMGPQPAGQISFNWNGKTPDGTVLPNGSYRLVANASSGAVETELPAMIKSRVNSVGYGGQTGALELNVEGIGSVDFSSIRQIG